MNQSIRRALSVLAMVLLLTGTLAACGTSSNKAEPTVTRESVAGAPPTRTPTVPGQETPATGGAASPAPSTGGGQAAGGQPTTVEVDMVDIAFTPAEVRIPANTDVTIHAVNSGALPHTLTIPNVGDTGEVPAGSSHDLQVNLPPGEYPFHCAIPGHEAAGMVGTLIVEEGAAAPAGGAASPAAGGQAAAPSGPVEIDMVDLAFNPTELTIPANTDVTIHAVNSGALPHTFTIPDVADTGEVAPGSSTDVTVNLPPGEYDFHCAVPGHEAAGMVGKLIVQEGGGAAPQGTEQAVVHGSSPQAAGAPGEVKTEATPPSAAASPAVSGQPGEVASPAAGGQAELPTTIEADMVDLAFQPDQITIPANMDVTIHAVNKGALPHTFTIPDVADTGEVAAGDSKEITVNLPAGEYDFDCAVPGHKEAGMVGKLIVVESGGAAGAASPAASPGASPATSPVAQSVDLDMVELRFIPDTLEIPADTNVQINLSNSGNLPHNFSIKDQDVSVDLAAGDKTSFVLNLPAGTYEFFCNVPGHESAGMVGTLSVKEGATASPTAAAAGGGSANLPTTYDMNLKDIAFDPAELTIPANTDVTINLTNSGVLEHTFDIENPKVESGVIPGGGTGQVTLNLPPGEYEYICIIPGHKDAGMVGKLIVK